MSAAVLNPAPALRADGPAPALRADGVETLLRQLGPRLERGAIVHNAPALALGWPELDAALPDGGLPRGVVELAAPRALGGSTSVALAAVRSAQQRAKASLARSSEARGRAQEHGWCAWIDPEGTLYAPGVAKAGVDLARMLVVRPPRAELARVAVKVTASRAFDVVVVDFDPVEGARPVPEPEKKRKRWPPDGKSAPQASLAAPAGQQPRLGQNQALVVRKLALAAEEAGAIVLLLTDASAPRAVP
jgi:recombination protein RecA